MNTFVLEKWDDEGEKCTFYTVRWDTDAICETDKFFDRFDQSDDYRTVNQELLSFVLDVIGDNFGAKDELFNRFENEVTGLPTKGEVIHLNVHYPNFPLRLYALKIRENIVILFNGGVKDGSTNQTSSLHLQWKEACQFANRIDEAIFRKDILIDEKNRLLRPFDQSEEIIL